MRIRYETRNGKRYAYTCTSKWVEGKDSPVSEKIYLGVVNPETGEIETFRKNPVITQHTVVEEFCDSKDFGPALVLKTLADRLGITKNLDRIFGDRGKLIMAMAMSQAVRPSSFKSVGTAMKLLDLQSTLGLDDRDITSRKIDMCLRSVTNEEYLRFTYNMLPPGPHDVLAYLKQMTTAHPDPLRTFDRKGTESIGASPSPFIAYIMDVEGTLKTTRLQGRLLSDVSLLKLKKTALADSGIKIIFILDCTRLETVMTLMKAGFDVVAYCDIDNDKHVRNYVEHLNHRQSSSGIVDEVDGKTVEMWTHTAYIGPSSKGYGFTLNDNPDGNEPINLVIMKNEFAHRRELDLFNNNLNRMVRELKTYADLDEYALQELSGVFSECVTYRSTDDGLEPYIKREVTSRIIKHLGTTVLLTSLNSGLDAYRFLTYANIQSRIHDYLMPWTIMMGESGYLEAGSSLVMSVSSLMFSHFIKICNDNDLDVDYVMALLSEYRTIRSGDTKFKTLLKPETEEIISLFTQYRFTHKNDSKCSSIKSSIIDDDLK